MVELGHASSSLSEESITRSMRRVFRQLLAFVVLLAVALVAVFGYLVLSIRPDQARYRSAGRALELAHAGMVDQETGLRGYLLGRDPAFLGPYKEGVAAVRKQNGVLSRTLAHDPRLAPLLLDMRVAEQAWASEWADTVVSDPAAVQAQPTVYLGRGKTLFDAYRSAELRLRDHLWARRDSLYAREGHLLVLGLTATLLLGAALLLAVLRQRRRLEGAVVTPVNEVVEAMEAVSRGDLEVGHVPSGAAEFQRIGRSLNRMREGLIAAGEEQRSAQSQIEAQAGQLAAILAMSREISGSLNLRYVLRTVADVALSVSGFDRVALWLADGPAAASLVLVYDSTRPDGRPDGPARVELGAGVVGQAVRYGRSATSNDAGEPIVEVHPEHGLRSVAVPLVVGARVTGALELASAVPHQMSPGSFDVVETLTTHAAAAIEAARLHSDTEELAHSDALTGLANRRRLDHDLLLECERAARYRRPLALVMFDVDHFKRLNDTFGHGRGDEVLQELAVVVGRTVRSTDTVYRYGGEEFVVLARETSQDDACQLAERLRARIEEHFGSGSSATGVTASFGVSLVPPAHPEPSTILASADAALYRSKAEGRNRVSIADSS